MLDATPPVTTRQVSVAEAARELGISTEMVRRWIKSGRLEARRTIRAQGTVWEVSLPVTVPRGVPPVTPVTGHSEAFPSEPGQATPDEAWYPSSPVAHHTGDATALVASNARLIAELAEVRLISDRRANQLVSQAETIGRQAERVANLEIESGRLLAQVFTLRASQQPVDAPAAPESPDPATEPSTPRWRAWAPWLPVLLMLAVVLAALLVPR
jgi:excisionase family DNA binding protein